MIAHINRLLDTAWRNGVLSRPKLDAKAIYAAGSQRLPHVAFTGRRDWLDRLRELTDALRSEARLNPLGRCIAYGQLVRNVRQRLLLEQLWQDRPEILTMRLPPPVIVLGHMRSGTTRMQRMLACDPRFAATRFCDSWCPVPPEGRDWRPMKAAMALKAIALFNPRFRSIHPTTATATDEEIGWLGLDWSPTPHNAQWHIPSFVAAQQTRSARSNYVLLRQILQTWHWHHSERIRPHILKVPQYMEDIGALLAMFPDAKIVRVTRDLPAVVASSCSLVANQRAVQSDHVDLHALGREWLERTRWREQVVTEKLAQHKGIVATVDFADMDRDWRRSMRGIYRTLSLGLPEAVLAAMGRHARLEKKDRNAHHYQLADFGLTADSIG